MSAVSDESFSDRRGPPGRTEGPERTGQSRAGQRRKHPTYSIFDLLEGFLVEEKGA